MSRSDGTQIPGSSIRAGSDQVEEARLQPAQLPETPKAAEGGESPGKDFIPCSWDEASELKSANERLSREVAERLRSEEALRNIAEGVSANVGEEFFSSLVLHLAETLNVDYAFVGELVGEEADRVRTISAYANGVVTGNVEYELAGTPCENVVAGSVCSHAHGVQELFPRDHMLAEMGVESYVGAPLFNSAGCPLGIVVVLDSRPLSNPELVESMLRIFAVRAAAELERRRVEEALLESEELLRTIFDSVKDEIVLVDANGTVLDVNQRVFDITGFSPDEVIGRNFADPDFLDADELQRLSELFAVSVAHGRAEALPIEAQVKHRDGHRVPIEVTTNALSAADGTLSGFVSISRDITERKRAEEALRESEERYRTLSDSAFEGIALSEEGAVVDANQQLADMLGYDLNELPGMGVRELVAPEDQELVEHMMLSGNEGPYEPRLVRRDGTVIVVEVRPRMMSIDGRRVRVTAVRDITERRRTEEALQESEERFRSLYSAMAEGVALHEVIYDESGRAVDYVVTDVSPSFEQILGIKREEAVGSRASELYGTGEAPFLDIYARTADTGEPAHLETYFPPLDRHFTISVICPAKGKFATIFYDITERKQAAEALQKAHDEMEGQVRERTADLTTANSALRQEVTERKQAEEELRQSSEQLRKSEQHYSALVGNLSDAVFLIKGGLVAWCNDVVEEIYGYPKDELLGKNASFFYPNDMSASEFEGTLSAEIRERGLFRGTSRFCKRDGSLVDLEYSLSVIPGRDPVEIIAVSRDITGRRLVEEALRASEESYRAVVENASEAIIVSQDGMIRFFNPRAVELSGYSGEELASMSFARLIHSDDLQTVMGYHERRLQGDQCTHDYSFRCVHKNGDVRWFENSSVALTWEGRPASLGFLTDVTERRRAEEALRESEEKYRLLVDTSSDPIALYRTDGSILLMSAVGARSLGGTPDDFVGKSVYDLVPNMVSTFTERTAQIVKTGEGSSFEDVIESPAGRRWVWTNLQPVRDSCGEIVAIQTISRDITERKQAEEALRESEEKFRNIVECSPLGMHMYQLEPDGRLVFVGANCAADETLGVDNRQFIGKTIEEAFPALAGTEVPERYRLAAAEGVRWHIDQITYEDNHISGAFQIDAFQTSPGRMVCMFLDITQRKQAEEELRRSSEQLREFSTRLESVRETERTTIARDIHDDLGQVLTVLKMGLSALEKRLAPEQQPLIERTKSMSQIVDGAVKQVQRICSELRPRLLDDLGLTAAIEWQAQDFAERTGIRCDVAPESADVVTDRECATAVFRVFQEALTNVARHANASRVRVHLKRVNGSIELEVNDNGRGISREQVSAFHSLGLTGMGERARSLGGEVTISGRPNKGTTVALTIPVERQEGGDD